MTSHHPITPPPELVQQWAKHRALLGDETPLHIYIANRAAQWGADQQLEEDAKWLDHNALNEPHLRITPVGESLKEAMRPKLSSLKERALQAWDAVQAGTDDQVAMTVIRRALEQLDD
jgi:hypothetical protein